MERPRDHGHHLVLLPCPLQGHLNPMLHLADLLLHHGFSVTVIQIPSPSWRSLGRVPPLPSLFFEPIYAGDIELDDGDGGGASNAGEDVMSFLLKLNSKCREPFRGCLERVRSDTSRGPVLCMIHDAVLYFPVDVEVPRLVLRTSTAANFLGLSLLDQKGFLPPQETKLMEGLQDLPSMRAKDLPLFDKCSQESTEEVLAKIQEGTKTASAIIWNTLTCLEQSSLVKIREDLQVPIFPIGPLHKLSAETGVSWTPRNQRAEGTDHCIDWLDSQPPGSVVYSSFGSLVTLSEHELTEIAHGLAESGHPFLCVARAGLVNSVSMDAVRDLAGTGGRGKITSWAPQRDVLAHRSVGCFWTHSGWNSTLESLCEGVPMLCWPNVGDQRIVSRLVTGVWKVGLELEVDGSGSMSRSQVSSAVRRMMSEEEGKEMKRRAMALKEEIEVSLRQGGSSQESLGELVIFIRKLARQ